MSHLSTDSRMVRCSSEELSAMKLYVIMMKVRNPPVMFCIGSTVPSQTHLEIIVRPRRVLIDALLHLEP